MISSPKNVLCGLPQQFLGDSLLPLKSRSGRFSGLRIDTAFLGALGDVEESVLRPSGGCVLLTGERRGEALLSPRRFRFR